MADIVDSTMGSNMFKTLVMAIKTSGLVDMWKGPDHSCFLLPWMKHSLKYQKQNLEMLMKDTMKLKNVLTFHLAEGNIVAENLAKHECLQALQGGEVRIDSKTRHLHRNIKVNGAKIIKPDIVCDNGVCHASDKVLMPRWQRWQNKKMQLNPVIQTGNPHFFQNKFAPQVSIKKKGGVCGLFALFRSWL